MICIFWPEFVLKPRYLVLHVTENGKVFLKHRDLIDMLNDTSRYLDDIFTIDNPEFQKKNIHDIYQTELQLNKANTSDKET